MLNVFEWLEWMLVNWVLFWRGVFPKGMFYENQEQNFKPGDRYWNYLRASLVAQGVDEALLPPSIQEAIPPEEGVLGMFYSIFGNRVETLLADVSDSPVSFSTAREEKYQVNSTFYIAVETSLANYQLVYGRAQQRYTTEFDREQLVIINEHISELQRLLTQASGKHVDSAVMQYCARLGRQMFPFPYGHTIFSKDPYDYANFCQEINDHIKALGRGRLRIHNSGVGQLIESVEQLTERTKTLEASEADLRAQVAMGVTAAVRAADEATMSAVRVDAGIAKMAAIEAEIAARAEARAEAERARVEAEAAMLRGEIGTLKADMVKLQEETSARVSRTSSVSSVTSISSILLGRLQVQEGERDSLEHSFTANEGSSTMPGLSLTSST